MTDRYYRGQGSVYLSERDQVTGQPTGGFRFLGNVPTLRISTTTQQIKHQESYTGQQLTDLVIETTKEAQLTMTLEYFDAQNLAFALYGTPTVIAGATVTNEAVIAQPGRHVPLANINLSAFTSLVAGATTYVQGTDYVVNLKSGMISFPTDSTIAAGATVRANYVSGNTEKVSAFTRTNKEFWLRFDGLNTAENDNPVVIDCYRVRFMPQKQWDLIGNELSSMELDGDILFDSKQPNTAENGRFFRQRQVAPAA